MAVFNFVLPRILFNFAFTLVFNTICLLAVSTTLVASCRRPIRIRLFASVLEADTWLTRLTWPVVARDDVLVFNVTQHERTWSASDVYADGSWSETSTALSPWLTHFHT